LVHARRRGRSSWRRLARRPPLRRELARDSPLPVEEPRAQGGGAGEAAAAVVAQTALARLPRRARAHVPRGRAVPRLGRRPRVVEMSRRLDGGSNVAAVRGWTPRRTEAPAWPAPEQDGLA